MIRFSFVTICYNAAPVIGRTLDSILHQSYPGIEHIIIDGASADDTLNIIRKYEDDNREADNEHTVVVVSEPDKGIYDAMNKGLRMATGDYVCFMNAGDCLHTEDTVEQIVAAASLDADGADESLLPGVVYGDTVLVDDEGHYLGPRHLSVPEKLTWRSFLHGMLVCHQSFYARRDIAQATEYDLAYRYSADVDWCIRVMKECDARGLQLVNAGTVLTDYLKEGQTTLHHRDSLKERFRVMARHYGTIPTTAMHCWFAVRAAARRITKKS